MSSNVLSAVLVFSLLTGGTVAIGSEMFRGGRAAPVLVATLPAVEIVGRRDAALDIVTLPTVEIVGRRDAGTPASTSLAAGVDADATTRIR